MDIRRVSFVIAFLLVPSLAHADRHRADAAAAFAAESGGSLIKGFRTSFAVPVFKNCKDVSLVGEVSRFTHEDKGTRSVLPVYLVGFRYTFGEFGPRYTASVPPPAATAASPTAPTVIPCGSTHTHAARKKLIWFAQGLIGVTERTETIGSLTTKEPVHLAGGAALALEMPTHYWLRPRFQLDVLAYDRHGSFKVGVGFSVGLSVGESTLKLP